MRKVIYQCDGCKRELGTTVHIHVKRAYVGIAYYHTIKGWGERCVDFKDRGEYQFYDVTCLTRFLNKHVDATVKWLKANSKV